MNEINKILSESATHSIRSRREEQVRFVVPTGKVRFYDAEKGFGFLTKDDGGDKASTSTTATDANITVLGQTNLRPPADAPDKDAVGIAQFVERKADGKDDPEKLLNVIAQGLPKAPKNSGYGVWLTKTGVKPVWLGYFQAVTTSGEVGAQSALKVNPQNYDRVILTRQTGANPTTPSTIYLEGAVNITKPSSG